MVSSMKKSIFTLGALAIAVALTAGFTACSNEDNLMEETPTSGQAPTYSFSIPANFGGPETRAVEPGTGDKAGYLVSKFRTTDNIFVYNTNLGVVASKPKEGGGSEDVFLHADADASEANLTGELTFWKYGEGYKTVSEGDILQLIYNNNNSGIKYSVNYDGDLQPGTLAGLNTWDFATAEVTVTGINGSELGYTLTTTDAHFENCQSMYKFIFTGMPNDVGVKTVEIHSAGDNLIEHFDLINNIVIPADITINLGSETCCDGYSGNVNARREINNQGAEEGQNIVYAALRFQEIAADATDDITFTVEGTDDNIYIATKTSPMGGFKNSKYYTSTIALTQVLTVRRTDDGSNAAVEKDGKGDFNLTDRATYSVSGVGTGNIRGIRSTLNIADGTVIDGKVLLSEEYFVNLLGDATISGNLSSGTSSGYVCHISGSGTLTVEGNLGAIVYLAVGATLRVKGTIDNLAVVRNAAGTADVTPTTEGDYKVYVTPALSTMRLSVPVSVPGYGYIENVGYKFNTQASATELSWNNNVEYNVDTATFTNIAVPSGASSFDLYINGSCVLTGIAVAEEVSIAYNNTQHWYVTN